MELVEINFALTGEPSNLLAAAPLCRADLTSKVLAQSLHESVGNPGRILVVRHTDHTQLVRPDEDVAHVLRLLHALPGPHPRPLHQDLRGEGDEVLGGAPLEKTDTGEIVASLRETQ